MKRTHWTTTAAALLALAAFAPTAWTAPAETGKSALAWVPAAAPIVIHLNSPETLRDHVVAFLKAAVPDQADRVQQHIDDFLKNGADGRKLRGLAKDGPIFVALSEIPKDVSPDKPPKVAIIAAVTSYAEFRDNILTDKEKKSLKQGDGYESATAENGNHDIFFVDRKDYVVVTPTKDLAAAYVKGAPGLDGKLGKAQAGKLLGSDAGVYVDLESVNKEFGDQLKAARKEAIEQFKKLAESVPQAQKGQFEMVQKMLDPLFQAIEDGKSVLAAAEVGPNGVTYHEELEFRASTPTTDLLKGSKTVAFKDLGKLPAGDVFYAGMVIGPSLTKLFTSIMAAMASDPNAKGGKAMVEAYEAWAKAGPTEVLSAVTYPTAGVSVTKADDPAKLMEASVKVLTVMGEEGAFPNVYFKDKPEIKPNAQKYHDISFTSIHMVWDLDKMLSASSAQLPEAARKQMTEAMKKMMGEEMNAWIGADGKSVIQVTAKDWDSAQKVLDQYFKGEGGAGDDKSFAAVRKALPEQASVVALIDVVQAVGDILDFVKPILDASGAPVPNKFPKPIKGKPGFIGFAITLEPDRCGCDLSVASDAVKQIYQGYISPLLPKD
jgi:hypothetical protein